MFALSQLHGFNAVQGGDPYCAYVVSLLRVIEANGSTTVTDDKGISWSTSGSTGSVEVQDNAIEITANGTDNKYLYASDNSLIMGTGDFTYEIVFSTNTIEYLNNLVRLLTTNLMRVSSGSLGYLDGIESLGNSTLFDFLNNTDYYTVVKRVSGVVYIEIDGVEVDSFAYANNININSILLGPIGYVGSGVEKIKIKAFRVTKGIARPLSSMPSLPLPACN